MRPGAVTYGAPPGPPGWDARGQTMHSPGRHGEGPGGSVFTEASTGAVCETEP